MNMPKTILHLTFPVLLLAGSCYGPRINAQQLAAANPEQEFLDAIKKGNSARVDDLLKQNPALIKARNKNGTTPVLLAVYARHPEIAELLATGIELNIFEAAATGRVGRVRELLKKNPELVKAYSADGWTALHLNFGNLEIVKLTLDSGADINAVSARLSATPLQGAAAFQDRSGLAPDRSGRECNRRGEGGGSPFPSCWKRPDSPRCCRSCESNAKDDKGKTL